MGVVRFLDGVLLAVPLSFWDALTLYRAKTKYIPKPAPTRMPMGIQ